MFYIILFILLQLDFLNAQSTEANDTVYNAFLANNERLMKHVVNNSRPDVPLIYTLQELNIPNKPKPFEININIQFIKLIDLVEPAEKVTFILDYIMYWNDRRIKWNPSDFGNINYTYVGNEKLWIPQLHVVNTHDIDDHRPDYSKISLVRSTGNVYLYVSQITSIVCNIDVSHFPFDTQRCEIQMLSLVYYVFEYKVILWPYEWTAQHDDPGSGEWQVVNISAESRMIPVPEVENGDYYINSYFVTMKRNSSFYVTMIIIPSFVINILSILGMFLTRGDKMGKLTVALTNLMSTTFILGILEDSVPKTKKLSLLAIYVLINLSIIMAAVVATIIIPIAYGKYIRNIVERRKVSNEKDTNEQNFEVNPAKDKGFVRGLSKDRHFWNRALLIVLQAANIGNLIYIFVA